MRSPYSLRRHPGERRAPEPRASRLRLWIPAFAGLTMLMATAHADSARPPEPLAYTQLADPAKEARARALMETLRCLVCQGQSIADSDAEMAGDMRALVRQRIQAGESPDRVRAWLVQRYGDYVTYDPPLSWVTAPLWIAPIVLLIAGLFLARRLFRREAA